MLKQASDKINELHDSGEATRNYLYTLLELNESIYAGGPELRRSKWWAWFLPRSWLLRKWTTHETSLRIKIYESMVLWQTLVEEELSKEYIYATEPVDVQAILVENEDLKSHFSDDPRVALQTVNLFKACCTLNVMVTALRALDAKIYRRIKCLDIYRVVNTSSQETSS